MHEWSILSSWYLHKVLKNKWPDCEIVCDNEVYMNLLDMRIKWQRGRDYFKLGCFINHTFKSDNVSVNYFLNVEGSEIYCNINSLRDNTEKDWREIWCRCVRCTDVAEDRVGQWVHIMTMINLCVSVSNLNTCEFLCYGNNLNLHKHHCENLNFHTENKQFPNFMLTLCSFLVLSFTKFFHIFIMCMSFIFLLKLQLLLSLVLLRHRWLISHLHLCSR
jgi:hypothetical protein